MNNNNPIKMHPTAHFIINKNVGIPTTIAAETNHCQGAKFLLYRIQLEFYLFTFRSIFNWHW